MNKKYYKKDQPTVLETVIVGLFKGLWWLIKLPFKGAKVKKGINLEDKREILTKRHEIEDLLQKNSEIELKHAVLEADKLVDFALKLNGYEGETFADRLRSAEKYIDRETYQAIWEGHKVRNTLAHEHNANFSGDELRLSANNLLKYIRKI